MTELGQMPPPYSKGGYSKGGYSQVPQTDNCEDYYRSDPPYSAPAPVAPAQPTWGPPGYAPAPPVLQQQSSNTNVVVVGQPSTVPHTTIIQPRARANEYLALTLVLMVLCFLHGNLLAFFCLVPALICSCVASDHNNAGEYESAKQCGNMALGCNICAIVKYVIAIMAVIALVIVYFTVGFAWLTGASNVAQTCNTQCGYDYYGAYSCTSVCV